MYLCHTLHMDFEFTENHYGVYLELNDDVSEPCGLFTAEQGDYCTRRHAPRILAAHRVLSQDRFYVQRTDIAQTDDEIVRSPCCTTQQTYIVTFLTTVSTVLQRVKYQDVINAYIMLSIEW